MTFYLTAALLAFPFIVLGANRLNAAIHDDVVLQWLRDRIDRLQDPVYVKGSVNEVDMRRTLRRAFFHEGLTCPRCTGFWISGGFTILALGWMPFLAAPAIGRVVAVTTIAVVWWAAAQAEILAQGFSEWLTGVAERGDKIAAAAEAAGSIYDHAQEDPNVDPDEEGDRQEDGSVGAAPAGA